MGDDSQDGKALSDIENSDEKRSASADAEGGTDSKKLRRRRNSSSY